MREAGRDLTDVKINELKEEARRIYKTKMFGTIRGPRLMTVAEVMLITQIFEKCRRNTVANKSKDYARVSVLSHVWY